MPFTQSTLHSILLLLLTGATLTAVLLLRRWQHEASAYYRTRSSTNQRQWLHLIGQEAYSHAERVYPHYDGPAKLNEAIKYALDRAQLHHLDFTYAEIRAVIECAWTEATASAKTL